MTEPDAHTRWYRVCAFVLLYLLMQAGHQALRGGVVETWVVERMTVAPAANLIATLLPQQRVHAEGPRLVWPDGRLRLLAGCDGLEMLTLLIAAVAVAPVALRRKVVMLAFGAAWVWALNQLRVLGLYASFRHWREMFDTVHMLWAPLIMLALLAVWFSRQLRDG